MNTIQEVVDTYQQKVMDSFPSVFSKGDVHHLLGEMMLDLEKVQSKPLLDIDIEEFKEDIIDRVERIINNHDIEDNVDLEMSGREIQVSFDISSLVDEIRDDISEFFDRSEIQNFITPKVYEE